MSISRIPFTILLLLLLVCSSCNSCSSPAKTGERYYKVTRIIDGDTFYVDEGSSVENRIRLIGIDAPESRRSQHKQVQPYGKEATAFLKELLQGKAVRLEYDLTRKDRYGRTLAYAYLRDGTFVNAHLLKEGYAILLTVPPNVKYADLFFRLQQEARKQQKGLWKK